MMQKKLDFVKWADQVSKNRGELFLELLLYTWTPHAWKFSSCKYRRIQALPQNLKKKHDPIY